MTRLLVDLENQPVGNAFTTASSDDFGDAICTVSANTETLVFSTDSFIGSRSLRLTVATGTNSSFFDVDDSAPSDSFSHSFYFKILSSPTVTNAQLPIGVRSLTAALGRVEMSTTNQVRVLLGAGTSAYTSALANNVWYRGDVYGSGLGTAASSMTFDVYVENNTGTPDFTCSLTGQTTAEQGQRTRFGKNAAAPNATYSMVVDGMVFEYGTAVPQAPRLTGAISSEIKQGGITFGIPVPGPGKPQAAMQRRRYSVDFSQVGLVAPQAETGGYNVTSGVTGSGTSVIIPKPVNTSDGDVLVACLWCPTNGSTWTPPAGWTQAALYNGTNSNVIYTKPIPSAASESATTYTFSYSGGTARAQGLIFRLTGGPATGIVDVLGSQGTTTLSAISAPSINTGFEKILLVGMWSAAHTTTAMDIAPPAGMVKIGQNSQVPSAASTLMVAAETIVVTGATGARVATPTPASNATVSGFLVSFSPATPITQDLVEGWGLRIF